MASDDVSGKFGGLKIKENKDINILLLGETGVGKSTFINAIANYLHFKSFKKASKAEELLILIPSVITVTNEVFEQVTIKFGSDNNEYQEIGAAGTQDVKTYVFPIGEGKTRLRLIDSPGMGDPRGIEQDDVNCENILAYLSQLQELHAICFLMKPNTTRKTVLFEYCVKQILSRLEKTASKNIIFIFTNTRGTDYTPGDTLPCLKKIVEDIKSKPPHVEIPLKDNIFCVDNEAFRFLVAMKNGVTFNETVEQRFIESWKNSSKQCWSLISYIVGDTSRDGLRPHHLVNTVSINEARRIIMQLSQPLADITQLIHDNIRILERHQHNLKIENQSLDELKNKLFIPSITLEVTELTQPVTVCTSSKCADMIDVMGVSTWHYRQRCHDPCYLTNVKKNLIGDVGLMHCAAMNGQRTCMKCTCDYLIHMHVYYLTKKVSTKIEDAVVKGNINKKEEALRESQRLINQIDQRKQELEKERGIVVKSTAQFAHFLQHNAISPFNDAYKGYIQYLISREQSLGRNGDREVINNLEQLLCQYEQIKEAFDKSLMLDQQLGLGTSGTSVVTARSVLDTIADLYRLKHNGNKIKELIKKQKSSRNSEYDHNCEYIHPKTSDLSHTEGKKDKAKKNKQTGGKTDDESKKKDKKKDGKSTDDERKPKQGTQNKNFNPQQRNRPYNQDQRTFHPPPASHFREPPPPYDATIPTRQQYPQHQQNPQHQQKQRKNQDDQPNIVVKVELSQSGKNAKQTGGQRNQQGNRRPNNPTSGPAQSGYHDGSYGPNQNYPPQPANYYQGPYHGPPQGQYYPPPPPGPTQGPYYRPPHDQHYGPPQGQYPPPPPPGQYQGPPGQYQGPPGQYQGPPGQYQPYYGQPHGPPQGHYQKQYSGPQHNQGNRGRNYKKGGGDGKRSHSKPRAGKGGKSSNEKSSRSSDSDSSD